MQNYNMSDKMQKMSAIYKKLYDIQSDEIYDYLITKNVLKPLSEEDRAKFKYIVCSVLGSSVSKKEKKQRKNEKERIIKKERLYIYIINKQNTTRIPAI